jgi:hypothetical protein
VKYVPRSAISRPWDASALARSDSSVLRSSRDDRFHRPPALRSLRSVSPNRVDPRVLPITETGVPSGPTSTTSPSVNLTSRFSASRPGAIVEWAGLIARGRGRMCPESGLGELIDSPWNAALADDWSARTGCETRLPRSAVTARRRIQVRAVIVEVPSLSKGSVECRPTSRTYSFRTAQAREGDENLLILT